MGLGLALALASCAAPPLASPRAQALLGTRVVDLRFGLSWARPIDWALEHPLDGAWVGEAGLWALSVMDQEAPDLEGQMRLVQSLLGGDASSSRLPAEGLEVGLVAPRSAGRDDAYAVIALPEPVVSPEGGPPHRFVIAEGNRGSLVDLVGTLRVERDARAYLLGALEVMEQHSVRRLLVPWPALRRDLAASAPVGAPAKAAHEAVGAAVRALGEFHSFFAPPAEANAFVEGRQLGGYGHELLPAEGPDPEERVVVRVHPGSPAAAAGLSVGTLVGPEAVDEAGTLLLELRSGPRAGEVLRLEPGAYSDTVFPVGWPLPGGACYLELPGITNLGALDRYTDEARALVAEGLSRGATGWVLDLRRNPGGYTMAMLPPLVPLLGLGPYGGAAFPDGRSLVDRIVEGGFELGLLEPPPVPPTLPPGPPVALLTGPMSASAAEELSLAFQGLPRARRFGLPTAGVPTATVATYAWDGGFLNVAAGLMRDRLGRPVEGPLLPDQPASSDYTRLGQPGDPAVDQALAWLGGWSGR